ncbi:MAG: hypothetical protein M3Q96_05410 [Pseudomonadota bacterium]|nr:hypothetical protein [Pseudomonadota bacterium]
MSTFRAATLTTLFLTLAACNRAPAPGDMAPPPAPGTPPPASAPTEQVAGREFGETLLWADPLTTCELGQTTTLHWSKEAVAKGPARIELGDTNPGVFARIGDAGEKQTGPWADPGGAVVLRGEDGVARARLVFKGPEACGGT